MDASHTRRLIKKLLDSRELMPETREELADNLADLERGQLHADDAAYVEALAQRLGIAAGAGPAPAPANDDGAADDDGAEDFALDAEEDHDPIDTAAAVQMKIALRAVEQARGVAARLRAPAAEGGGADTAALDELDKALGEAAEALAPRG